MLNAEDFVKRLEFLLSHFGLSAAAFSDKIGIQRSSVSHLLSGRNKPSLDFVMKITTAFPEVDLYWLLHGEGSMTRRPEEKNAVPSLSATSDKIIIFHTDGTFSEYKSRN